jgi:hypothetical protein
MSFKMGRREYSDFLFSFISSFLTLLILLFLLGEIELGEGMNWRTGEEGV